MPDLPGGLSVEFAGRSAVGCVRERNEDRMGWLGLTSLEPTVSPADEAVLDPVALASDASLFFGVADGLGAYGSGDVASGLAITAYLDHMSGQRGSAAGGSTGQLRSAFTRANQAVLDAAITGSHGGSKKMQSTLSALVLRPGEASLGHVGDCRIYRRRGEDLQILTADHSQVMELLRMRLVSPEQALTHPARYALTRSLGGDITVRVDVRTETLLPDDTFLLCSDGLWSNVSATEIRDALATPPPEACERLVSLALENGGDDNATAMVVHVSRAGTKSASAGWRRFFS